MARLLVTASSFDDHRDGSAKTRSGFPPRNLNRKANCKIFVSGCSRHRNWYLFSGLLSAAIATRSGLPHASGSDTAVAMPQKPIGNDHLPFRKAIDGRELPWHVKIVHMSRGHNAMRGLAGAWIPLRTHGRGPLCLARRRNQGSRKISDATATPANKRADVAHLHAGWRACQAAPAKRIMRPCRATLPAPVRGNAASAAAPCPGTDGRFLGWNRGRHPSQA
jgi:hypothetical protein